MRTTLPNGDIQRNPKTAYEKGYQQGRADQKKEDNEFFNFEGAWELEKQKIRADAIEEYKPKLLAFICKKYNIPLIDMSCTVDEFEEMQIRGRIMQCDKCLHNKNNVCMADASMSSAEFEHCYDFEDKTIYLQGAREFAEWLLKHPLLNGFDEEYFYTIRDCQMTIDEVLAEWQKEVNNA